MQQHGQQDAQGDDEGHRRRQQRKPRPFAPLRLARRAAVRQGVFRFPLRLGKAELAADIFFDLAAGQNVFCLRLQHLFDVFHALPSFSKYLRSFFSASLFFQVTVPMGICSIAATSRRL